MARSGKLEVPVALERTMIGDRSEWERSGVFAVELLLQASGRSDLADAEILDVGCGTKVVKALIDNEVAIGQYTGVDVSAEVIAWLRRAVDDDRFDFAHLNARNARYNPGGLPLADFEALPVGGRAFDLICLFSVFTHLDPADFTAMLGLLRRQARPRAKLLFSLYLTRADGSGIYLGPGEGPEGARFVDELPDQPLAVARYDEDYARELIEQGGWAIESLNPPSEPYIQNYVIASPAPL